MRTKNKNSNNIIHESRWAITERAGDKIYKIFLHDAYFKISKEVSLLELSIGRKMELLFDSSKKCWVCRSDYLELRPVIENIRFTELILQLEKIFCVWENDKRYNDLIADERSEITFPWYCSIIREHIPDSDEIITWLMGTKSEHFVHGDFTLSNIYLDDKDELLVLDYENATVGPLLWDETTLVYSFIEGKQHEMAKKLYEQFSIEREMLIAISCLRLAQSIKKNQNVELRHDTHDYILNNY